MAINPYLTAFLRNPLSPIQAAGSAVAQKIRKPVESLATEIARPAVVAGGLLYTGMKSGITGKNEVVDLGRFGKVSPIINPENIADTSGSRLVPETALGLALTASTLGTGNVARAASQGTLKTAVQTLGRSPLRNIASIVSPIQTGLAKLPVAGRLAVPVANTVGQAAKRFAVQGTTDFLAGAATSLAADKAAGRGYNVKNAAVSGGISTLFPLGVAGVTGTVRGASRGASARGVVRTVLEDADLLTRSAANPAKGNFGRVVRKALEDKEAQLAERVATQTAQNIKLGEATIESRFLPSFIQKAPKTKDEAKLKAVKFIRDFSKNFIDDRAPITTNLSGKLAERGATPEEVSALADAVSSLRASDSMTAGKLNRVREGMDSLRPQGVTEVEFQSALNAYADKKTKLETTRTDEAGIATVRQELDDLTSKLAPEVRQAVEQAHEQFVVNFNRELLEEQVEAGVYSREFADELLKKYPNYSKLIVKDYLEKPLSGAGKTVRSDVQGLKVAGRDVNAAADLESLPAMEANAIGAVVSRQNAERNKLVRNAVDLDAQYKTGVFEVAWSAAEEAEYQRLLKAMEATGKQKKSILDAASEKMEAIRKNRTERNMIDRFRKDAKKSLPQDIQELETVMKEASEAERATFSGVQEKIASVKQTMADQRSINAERNKFVRAMKSVKTKLKSGGTATREEIQNIRDIIASRYGSDTAIIEAGKDTLNTLALDKSFSKGRKGALSQTISALDKLESDVKKRFNALAKASESEKQAAIDALMRERDVLKNQAQALGAERGEMYQELQKLSQKKQAAIGEDTITLRRDGVEEHYKVKDRQVLEFFQGQQKKDEGTISKLLEAGADMTRLFATSVNPAFMIGNTIRDFLTSGGMMRGGVPVTLNNWARGYDAAKTIDLKGEGTKLDALAQKALDIGVPLTTYSKSGRNTDDVIGAISNLSAEKQGMLKTVERYNNISEVATRLAVLDAAMKSGITDPAALRKIARDATVDFQVAGTITRELNRKIPFLNARIQGLRNVLKRIGDDPAQVARQAQTLELAAQTILQGWNAQYGDLEKRISTQEKQDRFVMITGSYKDEAGVERPIYVSLPKGSFGQFVGVLRDAVIPNKDDKRTTKERSEDVLAGFIRLAPIDGIPDFGGAIFQTIRGIQSNKDWRGYDIVPAHLNKPEVSDRAKKGKTTSRVVEGITRGISKATGGTDTKEGLIELSPAKVEYVVKTLFSGSGTQAISAADMFYNLVKEGSGKALNAPDDSVMGQASKLPILSSFVRSRGLSVDPTVEKRNVEEIRNMSLLDVVEDDKAKELKARVLKAATPEERLKILKESDPETVKQVIEDAKKKVFIEGVNPYSPVEDQAIQITNALEAKSTPEARRELLQNLQQRGLLTEKKMEAMFAYKIARQVNTLSPEEKQALIQGLSERGVLTQEFLEQVARYRIMQQ